EDVEHGDGQVALHAEADGGGVHHREALVQYVEVRQRLEAARARVAVGIVVVDAVDLVLRHQHHVGVDLQRPQRGGGVGREERVAGAATEDHHAPLLQVTQRAASDVRLGDLLDGDGRLYPRVDALGFERVLQRDGVHHGAEHADVVGGGGVHVRAVLGTAPEVPATDDGSKLNAAALGRGDLFR